VSYLDWPLWTQLMAETTAVTWLHLCLDETVWNNQFCFQGLGTKYF
jgi:hypothetical protein